MKGHHNFEHKTEDTEANPILKYGPYNNLFKFNESLSKVALRQHGYLGKLIHQGSYYIKSKPDRAMYGPFDVTNDPDGIKKAICLEAMKQYQMKQVSMEDDHAKHLH